jgi:head-tail adaptor
LGQFLAAGTTNNEALAVFTIRYRPGIVSGLRAVCDGQTFTITGVSEIGRRQFLALQAKAVNQNAAG